MFLLNWVSYMRLLLKILMVVSMVTGVVACKKKIEQKGVGSAAPVSGAITEQGITFQFSIATHGPDVCFRKIRDALGDDVKVTEIYSYFGEGDDLNDVDSVSPKGALISCSVRYQDPSNRNKLLERVMDVSSGEFGSPESADISVSGDRATFRLDDHVLPISRIDLSSLKGFMATQEPTLMKQYSDYAWESVILAAPGSFNNDYAIRLGVVGRLRTNQIVDSSSAQLSLVGRVIDNGIGK